MNVADAAVSGGVTLGTLLISWAVKALFARDREKAAGRKDLSDAFARERETWRQDYDHAYDQVKSKCENCVRELNRMQAAFYDLLDDLEDQISPMLMLLGAEATRDAMNVCIRTARAAVRPDKDHL